MRAGIDSAERFKSLTRQKFRRYFQPSRVLIGIIQNPKASNPNLITLCFHMYCSYKPPMIAVAVQRGSLSHELIQRSSTCILAVPGEKLANEALFCGLHSGNDVDKITECNLRVTDSHTTDLPSLADAIANVETKIHQCIHTGDHVTAILEVTRFGVNTDNEELPLLSVGPRTTGYRVLAQKGIHRLASVEDDYATR